MISKEVAQFLGVAGKRITSVQDVIDILSNIKWNYRGRTLEPKDIPFTMTDKDGCMIIYDMTPTFLFGVFKPLCNLDLKFLFTKHAPKALREKNKKLERENKDLKIKLDKCKSVLNELD